MKAGLNISRIVICFLLCYFSGAIFSRSANPLVLANLTELHDEFNNNIIGDLSGAGVNVPKGTSELAAHTALAGDFDGDGKADPAEYLETTTSTGSGQQAGTWQVMLSGNGYAATRFTFGGTGYSPVAGDFDGDGKADPAIYAESTPSASSANSTSSWQASSPQAGSLLRQGFGGQAGQAGDWQVMLSGNGYATINFSLGGDPDRPVAGDFDGDRKADPAAYNMSTGAWSLLLSGSGYAAYAFNFGGAGYLPVVGDFDGNGMADPAIYEQATGNWIIRIIASGDDAAGISGFGGTGYSPVAGDFDGDGKADPAVMDLAGNWYVCLSSLSYARSGPFNFTVQNEPVLVSATSNDRFDPASITVSPGQVVQWHNADVDPHTVTADSANVVSGGPDSDSTFPSGIPADGTYSWTVPDNAAPGTAWYYHCRFHGIAGDGHGPGTGMAGTITVQ